MKNHTTQIQTKSDFIRETRGDIKQNSYSSSTSAYDLNANGGFSGMNKSPKLSNGFQFPTSKK